MDGSIRAGREGSVVTVRVRPRSRPLVEMTGEAVVIGVSEPPVEGRATEAARRALAGALGVPVSAVSVRFGARSRTKVFLVVGLAPDDVRARLRGSKPG